MVIRPRAIQTYHYNLSDVARNSLCTWYGPPDALANTEQTRLENELSQKVAKFEKRLSETDPVSGAPRYGDGMTAKVRENTTRMVQTVQRFWDPHERRIKTVGMRGPINCSCGLNHRTCPPPPSRSLPKLISFILMITPVSHRFRHAFMVLLGHCPRRQAPGASPAAGAGGGRGHSRGVTTRVKTRGCYGGRAKGLAWAWAEFVCCKPRIFTLCPAETIFWWLDSL